MNFKSLEIVLKLLFIILIILKINGIAIECDYLLFKGNLFKITQNCTKNCKLSESFKLFESLKFRLKFIQNW